MLKKNRFLPTLEHLEDRQVLSSSHPLPMVAPHAAAVARVDSMAKGFTIPNPFPSNPIDTITGNSKYTVTIRNRSGLSFTYTLNGKSYAFSGANASRTHSGRARGKVQISFLVRSGVRKTYSLDSGKSYVFKGDQLTLDLYRQ